jgi:hypothetical protein
MRNSMSNGKVSLKKAIQFHTRAYRTVQGEELNGKPTKNAVNTVTASLIGALIFRSGRDIRVSLAEYRVSFHFPLAKVRLSSLIFTLVFLYVSNYPVIIRVC